MFPGFRINAFKLGAAFKTISRFRACRSKDWNRRTRLSLKSFSVSRHAKDLIIREVYYAFHNMSSGRTLIWHNDKAQLPLWSAAEWRSGEAISREKALCQKGISSVDYRFKLRQIVRGKINGNRSSRKTKLHLSTLKNGVSDFEPCLPSVIG